jgi:hypothetical protein
MYYPAINNTKFGPHWCIIRTTFNSQSNFCSTQKLIMNIFDISIID